MTNLRIKSLTSAASVCLWATITAAVVGRSDASLNLIQESSPHQHPCIIDESNMFHKAPNTIISSIISDFRRHISSSSSFNIDVASSRLNDDGVLSLIEALLAQFSMQPKICNADPSESSETLLVKLSIAMNNLSPSGVSSVFNLLVKKVDEQTDANDEVEPIQDDALMDGLKNETNADHEANVENSDEITSMDKAREITIPRLIMIEELDLSYNDIGGHGSHALSVQLLDSIRNLCERGKEGGIAASFMPRVLTIENCGIGPAFCRSVGRGILNAFESKRKTKAPGFEYRPSALRFGGNNAIGDAGTVALAAALRMARGHDSHSHHVLEELDLSSCNVGDAGAEALALAIASNPGCLKKLYLSSNKISDAGATSLGRALVDANRSSDVVFDNIILDNNRGISDDGASALAQALACGAVKSISLRSCSIQAQGTSAFGRALVSLANRKNQHHIFSIDLSGNHFGTRKIATKRGAAGRLRDKASTNMRFIGKTLKGAAKRFSSETMGITADSDDDEEIMGGLIEEDEEELNCDKLQACGGHSFARELINSTQKGVLGSPLKLVVGMRQCSLDDGAVDALAASILGVGNYQLSIDVSMNSADDYIVHELMHSQRDSKVLAKMAKRHINFMDRIAHARELKGESGFDSFSDDEELSDFDIKYVK